MSDNPRPDTVVLVHGLWMTPRSWEGWVAHYEAKGFRDAFWLQSMASGHRGAYECIAAFSATDFRPDLEKVDVPTLVIHGDDDQIVPFEVGGQRSAELIRGAELKVYEGSPHALPDTDRDRLHADLLEFINS